MKISRVKKNLVRKPRIVFAFVPLASFSADCTEGGGGADLGLTFNPIRQ